MLLVLLVLAESAVVAQWDVQQLLPGEGSPVVGGLQTSGAAKLCCCVAARRSAAAPLARKVHKSLVLPSSAVVSVGWPAAVHGMKRAHATGTKLCCCGAVGRCRQHQQEPCWQAQYLDMCHIL